MQFTLTINQSKALEWGLSAQQAMLFSFLHQVPTWADARQIGDHTWFNISKTKIVKEMPLLTDKPDTAYRMMKQLAKADLLVMTSRDNKTFIRLTAKAISWNRLDGSENNPSPGNGPSSQGSENNPTSEKNPSQVGKKSEPGSENFPTNQGTNDPTPTLSGAREDVFQKAARLDDDGVPAAGKSHQFPMSLDWVPNPEMFAAQCLRACLPTDTQYAPHQLAKFTAHFADQPHRRHGESAWIAKLVDWVRNDIRRAKTAEQHSPGVRYASRQESDAKRSERDRIAARLANPNDDDWMEGLFPDENAASGACESGVYEAGSDLPQDVADIVYDRPDGSAGQAGGRYFDGEVVDTANCQKPGCSSGTNQSGGQRVAAERGAPDCDAQAAAGGLWDA